MKDKILEILPEISEDELLKLTELFSGEKEEIPTDELEKIKEDEYKRGYSDAEESFKKAEYEKLLDTEIERLGAKNVKAIKALLELGEIAFEDGEFTGLLEQLEKVKSECPYLFTEEDEKPKFTNSISQKGDALDFSKLSYKERLKLYREMPELYRELSK